MSVLARAALLLLCVCSKAFATEEDDARDAARRMIEARRAEGFLNISAQRRGVLDEKGKDAFPVTMVAGSEYLAAVAGDKELLELELLLVDSDRSYKILRRDKGSAVSFTFTPKSTGRHIFFLRALKGSGAFHFYLATKKEG